MFTAQLVNTDEELAQIAQLSASNLVTNISEEAKLKEGFVTWVYSLEALRALHAIVPSVIVKDGDKLAGYAITLTKECIPAYPTMASTASCTTTIPYKGRPLNDYRIYIMGQICVHPDYRGKGIVRLLYEFHRRHFSPLYDILFTEISTSNPRSLKAHEKIGFKIIDTRRDEMDEWHLVVWDWTEGEHH